MASKCLYEALISRADSIETDPNIDCTTYKREHTFIRIDKDGHKMIVHAGFYLDEEEWHLACLFRNSKKDMSDVLRSVVVSIVDKMTYDDLEYTFDQFVAAKCILDWLLYV